MSTIACLALLAISASRRGRRVVGVFLAADSHALDRRSIRLRTGAGRLVYGHLGSASLLRRRSRLWAAAAVSLVVVGTSAISDFAARSKFSTIMEYTGVVKPIDAAWVPATSVDAFVAGSEKLKKELDVLAKKPRRCSPEACRPTVEI